MHRKKKSNVFFVFVKFMYFFGAWPGKYGGNSILKGTRPIISLFITIGLLIPNIIKGFERIYNRQALIILLHDLMLLVHCLTYLLIICLLYANKALLDERLELLSCFQYFGRPPVVVRLQRMAKVASRVMLWGFGIGSDHHPQSSIFYCYILGILVLTAVEILNTEVCDMVNSFYGETTMCGVLFPLYMIHGTNKLKCFLLNCIMCYTAWRVVNIGCIWGICQLFTCLLLTARFELLIQQISCIDFRRKAARFNLAFCIKHYNYIVGLHHVSNAMISTAFVLLKFNFIIITALAFTGFMMKPGLLPALYSLSWIFGILLSNITGQMLIDRSTDVSLALYDTNWYYADVSTQKTLMIFMHLSQRPCKTRLGMFGEMSHASMKEAFSAFYAWVTLLLKVI